MKINIITSFPNFFSSTICSLLLSSKNNKIWDLNIIDLKCYGIGKHKKIDASPYSGGAGLILRPDVLSDAIEKNNLSKSNLYITSPKGVVFNQTIAKQFSLKDEITIICNRFEGVDKRVLDYYNITEISIGEFILLGGESAAMCVIESTVRLLNGVIKNKEAIVVESFSSENFIEYDHYTRPEIWNGMNVPKVLLSGDKKKIEIFKKQNSDENLIKYKRINQKSQ